jgi:DNA polymerase III delta subunit
MVVVRLYGDKHSSEESAQAIHEGVKEQNPDVIFYEFDLQGLEFKYLRESLSNCFSIRKVISAYKIRRILMNTRHIKDI